jgi:hypothetical protein
VDARTAQGILDKVRVERAKQADEGLLQQSAGPVMSALGGPLGALGGTAQSGLQSLKSMFGGHEAPAFPQGADPASAAFDIQHSDAVRKAWGDVGRAGAIGLGAGVGLKGLTSLIGLLRRHHAPHRPKSGPVRVELPYRTEEKRSDAFLDWLGGGSATDPYQIPWHSGAAVAAGAGGAVAGYKGLSALIHKLRASEGAEELEAARNEFRGALLGKHRGPGEKEAGDDDLGAELDRLFDNHKNGFEALVAKRAAAGFFPGMDETWGQWAGRAADTYGSAWAVPAFLAGAWGGSRLANATSHRATLEKAIKRRDAEKARLAPAEVFALPVPVHEDEDRDA